MGNREFQWRVKKVDGAYDALIAAGFVLQTEPQGLLVPLSPSSPTSPQEVPKTPREFLLWKAEGQIGTSLLLFLVCVGLTGAHITSFHC